MNNPYSTYWVTMQHPFRDKRTYPPPDKDLREQWHAMDRLLALEEREAQRRSFAYGNTHIGNPRVTRTMVDEAAEALTDTARLDFIEKNRLYLYADRNDIGESCYEVMDLFDQVIGEGATVRDAIDAALSASKAGNEAAPESSNARRDSRMNAKKYIAAREFTDKQGVKHKIGDRIEVDPEYGQELVRRGEVKEEPSAEQQPAQEK